MRPLLLSALLFLTLVGSAIIAPAQERLRLATTTSVQDSGLMPYLLPHFEELCKCKVDVIAVGTGQALKLGSNGDVDLVVAHDPQGERKFMDDGFGVNRKTFMFNDFVILGPAADPSRIHGIKEAAQALRKIGETGATFISRGDGSGTHAKEKALWQEAGIKPAGPWYLEIGQSMGAVLTMANEKQAYALSDRATYIARMNQLKLQVLVEGDPKLLNYYSAIQVNSARLPAVKSDLARRFINWLCSHEGQKLIGDYIVGGHKMFTPACDSRK